MKTAIGSSIIPVFQLLRILTAMLSALFFMAMPARAQWQPGGIPVCTATGRQTSVTILSRNGGAILAWLDERDPVSQVYAQYVNSAGVRQWAANGVRVSGGTASTSAPVMVRDGVGGAIVAWSEYHDGTQDIYAQRIDASGAQMWAPAGVPICQAVGEQRNPVIVSDGRVPLIQTPGAYIAWEDFRADPANADVYAQRVLGDGSVVWAPDGLPICNADGSQTQITITSDGASNVVTNPNGAILAWKDTRTPQLDDIFVQRIDPSGTGLWAANGEKLTVNGLSDAPVAVFLGGGNAIVGWVNDPAGLSDTYAQRIGTPGTWGNLTALCLAQKAQLALAGTSDGAGGAIYTWEDHRAASGRSLESDIYAQRMPAAGGVNWTTDGVPLCTVPGSQLTPALASDGQHGAIVAWSDHRKGFPSSDVYAQHVNGSGVTLWTVDGLKVNGPTGSAGDPAITTDGASGVFIGWTDTRNGNNDIFMTHLNGSGIVASVEPVSGAATWLEVPFPSPSAGPTTLRFRLAAPGDVSAAIYAADGRLVRELAREREFPAGIATLSWDGTDAAGRPVATGIYFVRLNTSRTAATARMIVVR